MRPSSLLRQTTLHLSKPLTLSSPSPLSAAYIRLLPSAPLSSSSLPSTSLCSSHSSQTALRADNPNDGASPISADDFHLYPHFFSLEQTRQLLAMSLAKLDGVDSVVKRRKRMVRQGKQVEEVQVGQGVLQDLFDQEYDFQEVCLRVERPPIEEWARRCRWLSPPARHVLGLTTLKGRLILRPT